jgi:hypothetical protein
MPCHPLEPIKCPSCGVSEGEVHRDVCPIYAFAGAKRQIYFAPSPEVKAAVPYTPGERQAKAVIPQPAPPKVLPEVDYVLQRLQLAFMESKRQADPYWSDDLWRAWDCLQKVKDRL